MFKFCGINCFYNYKQVLQKKKKKTQTANNLIFLPFIYVTSKIKKEDFPSGTVFKNPPAKAGDTGSSPGLGRSHLLWSNGGPTPRPLGPCSRAHAPGACVRNKRSPCKEKSVRCNQEQPLPTSTRGSLHSATETPRSQTNKILEKDETRTHLLQQTFYVARDNVLTNELLNDWV